MAHLRMSRLFGKKVESVALMSTNQSHMQWRERNKSMEKPWYEIKLLILEGVQNYQQSNSEVSRDFESKITRKIFKSQVMLTNPLIFFGSTNFSYSVFCICLLFTYLDEPKFYRNQEQYPGRMYNHIQAITINLSCYF